MELGIAGRVAVIPGGTRGLGLAVARLLAAEGVNVVVCGRDKSQADQAAAQLRAVADAGHVVSMALDITHPDAAHTLVDTAVNRFGSVDIVVPNAGGPPKGGAIDVGPDPDAWRAALDANFFSTIRLVCEALPHQRGNSWGRVVIIGSAVVKEPVEGLVLSNAPRAATWAWAKTLSREVAAEGITVNMALPGLHDTDRVRERTTPETLPRRLALIPAGRLGTPDEFASLVAFLASQPAGYITGQAITADGGASRYL